MESLGDKVSKEEAEAMIKQADVDGDGNVDYNGTVYKFEKKKSVFCQKKKKKRKVMIWWWWFVSTFSAFNYVTFESPAIFIHVYKKKNKQTNKQNKKKRQNKTKQKNKSK